MLPNSLITMMAMANIFVLQVGAGSSFQHPVASADEHPDSGMDFSNWLKNDSTVQPRIKNALQTLDKLDALPSCQRMAFAGLMTSCATLETGNDDNGNPIDDQTLSKQTKLYAVRLAVCERSEAMASIPVACSPLIPTEQITKRHGLFGYFFSGDARKKIVSYPDYEETTKANLGPCLAEMQKDGQMWNSYSNALQTVATLCHAVRPEIDKEMLLHLHKALNEDLEANLDTLRDINEHGRETALAHEKLSKLARQALVDFHEDNQEMQARLLKLWGGFEDTMRARFENAALSVDRVDAVLQDTKEQARDASQHVSDLKEAALQINTLLGKHRTDIEAASISVETREDKMNYAVEVYHQRVMQILNEVSALGVDTVASLEQIHMSSTKVSARLEDAQVKLENIDEKLDATTETMDELGGKVLAFSGYVSAITGAASALLSFGPAAVWWAAYFSIFFCILCILHIANFCRPGGTALIGAFSYAVQPIFSVVGALMAECTNPAFLFVVLIFNTAYMIFSWHAADLSRVQAAVLASISALTALVLGVQVVRRRASRNADEEKLPEFASELEKTRFCFYDPQSEGFKEESW